MTMDSNTISLIILVLVLAFCCGPMLFMMGRRGKKPGNDKENSGTTEKSSNETESK
jgi:hypothetical protein